MSFKEKVLAGTHLLIWVKVPSYRLEIVVTDSDVRPIQHGLNALGLQPRIFHVPAVGKEVPGYSRKEVTAFVPVDKKGLVTDLLRQNDIFVHLDGNELVQNLDTVFMTGENRTVSNGTTLNELRGIIRYIVEDTLAEAAATSQVASSSGLALMRRTAKGQTAYILYVPSEIEKMLVSGDIETDSIAKAIVGYMSVKPHEGEAWNAGEVKLSAAQKGYGPLMYQLAMNDYAGGLFPDRGSTSPAARVVWQKYNQRADVEKKPFDDPKNPKTPDRIDDMIPARGTTYDGPEAYLNQAYDAPGDASGRSGLMQAHQTFLQTMATKGINKLTVEAMIDNIGDEYFGSRYRDG